MSYSTWLSLCKWRILGRLTGIDWVQRVNQGCWYVKRVGFFQSKEWGWSGCHGEEEIKVQAWLRSSKVYEETCWVERKTNFFMASRLHFSPPDINDSTLTISVHSTKGWKELGWKWALHQCGPLYEWEMYFLCA